MEEDFDLMMKGVGKAAGKIKSHTGSIRVLTHYDADGITSAAIMAKALFREGKTFRLTLLKQLNEKSVSSLSNCRESLILFLDFGSGQIQHINKLKQEAIIVDHHQPQGFPNPGIMHINTLEFGITENISSSGITYFLSKAMDENNRDLSELAVIGAIGDSQMGSAGSEWSLFGLNRIILNDAVEAKKINVKRGLRIWGRTTRPLHKALEYCTDPHMPGISGSESGAVQLLQETGIQLKKESGEWRTISDLSSEEQRKLASAIVIERVKSGQDNPGWIFGDVYELLDKDTDFRDANEFATLLNACGKLGRAYIGVATCLNDQKAFPKSKATLEEYRKAVGAGIKLVNSERDCVRETENAIYILAGNRISEHLISNVVSVLSKSFNQSKPVFALANSEEGVKISARASALLVRDGCNLKELLSVAAGGLGGEGGGHSAASGATIPSGSESLFISSVENLLKKSQIAVATDSCAAAAQQDGSTDNNIKLKRVIEEDGKGSPTTGPAAEQEGPPAKAGGFKKMERKGLVLYLNP